MCFEASRLKTCVLCAEQSSKSLMCNIGSCRAPREVTAMNIHQAVSSVPTCDFITNAHMGYLSNDNWGLTSGQELTGNWHTTICEDCPNSSLPWRDRGNWLCDDSHLDVVLLPQVVQLELMYCIHWLNRRRAQLVFPQQPLNCFPPNELIWMMKRFIHQT